MLRRIFRDGLVYGVGNILLNSISFFLLPLYTRVLSPYDYGVIDTITIIGVFVNLTIALEVIQGFSRFFGESQNVDDKIGYSSTTFWFVFGVYIIAAMFGLVFHRQLEVWVIGVDNGIMFFAIWMMFSNGLFYMTQNQLRWDMKPYGYVVSSALFTICSIVVTIVCVVVLRWGVAGFLLGQTVGNVVGVMSGFWYSRDKYRFLFDYAKLMEMLRFSVPLLPSSIGVFLALYVDRIVVKQLMSFDDLGVFGIGYRISSTAMFIVSGVQMAITPLVYAKYKEPDTSKEIAKFFRYFVAVVICFVSFVSLFSFEILTFMVESKYLGAVDVIPFLTIAVIVSNMYIFAPGLWIYKKTAKISLVNVSIACVNLILGLLLVPIFGLSGAAISVLTGSLFGFTLNIWISQKYYYIPYDWFVVGVSVCVLIPVIGFSLLVDFDFWLVLLLKFVVLGGVMVSIVLSGLIKLPELKMAWWTMRDFLASKRRLV